MESIGEMEMEMEMAPALVVAGVSAPGWVSAPGPGWVWPAAE